MYTKYHEHTMLLEIVTALVTLMVLYICDSICYFKDDIKVKSKYYIVVNIVWGWFSIIAHI